MSFSDRLGITQPKSVLQVRNVDDDLRNCLWEACREFYLRDFGVKWSQGPTLGKILRDIYVNYSKTSTDNMAPAVEVEFQKIKGHFYEYEWYDVYNFIEFLSSCAVRNFQAGTNPLIHNPVQYDASFRSRVNFF